MTSGTKILIVEDETVVRRSLVRSLEDHGYQILGAISSGQRAVEMALEREPDLVLMDVVLEGEPDGIEAAERIRACKDIPLIFLSAHTELHLLDRAKKTEPYAYLTKPVALAELFAAIEITLYKHGMEKRLRESEARYRAIVEDQTEYVCRFTPDMQLTFANDACCRYCGKEQDKVIGSNLFDLMPREVCEGAKEHLASLTRESPSAVREHQVLELDGATRWLEWTDRALFDNAGRLIEFQSVGRDITDRKRAESLIIRAARFKAIADLTGGVAHSFNNLLQIILGSADFALVNLEEGDLRELKSDLKQIINTSRVAGKVVKSLQDFTRGHSGDQESPETVVDLSETVEEAVILGKPWWKTNPEKEGKTIFLNRNLAEGCLVHGEESDLRDVVLALIKNAVEALPDRGEIRVTTRKEDAGVLLRVWDDGPGIPEEHLSRIFEPFWTGKGPPFLGLGLTSAQGIVKRHGGEIFAESRLNEGTVFTVSLPCAEMGPSEEPEHHPVPRIDFKLNILAVDDEPLIARLLEGLLTKHGQTVFSAVSGKEAIRIFKENRIDLVICDLVMPEMDGWGLLKRLTDLCEEAGRPKPPYILLTGWSGQALAKEKIAESGVDEAVHKPLETWRLLLAVSRVVKRFGPAGDPERPPV